jgi:hypothetical protein
LARVPSGRLRRRFAALKSSARGGAPIGAVLASEDEKLFTPTRLLGMAELFTGTISPPKS